MEIIPYEGSGTAKGIDLLAAQRAFVAATERFVAFIGGVGSGKTMAGAIKTIQYVLDHPGAVGVVGAPNRTVLRDVTQRTLLECFALIAPAAIKQHKISEGHILLHNGSEILLRSMDDYDHRRGIKYLISSILAKTLSSWLRNTLRHMQ
jgi:phage terminase large subunit